jgi:hypothetical protein
MTVVAHSSVSPKLSRFRPPETFAKLCSGRRNPYRCSADWRVVLAAAASSMDGFPFRARWRAGLDAGWRLHLALRAVGRQPEVMNKAVKQPAKRIRSPQSLPSMRKSRSAQESFAAEMQRLRAMSIEERVLEALGMDTRLPQAIPGPKAR